MESDIIKKISPNDINEIFDKCEVNIRYFEPYNKTIINNFDKKIKYRIRIRHNENENPGELLNNAIKKLK